ncbi:MAG: ABC transporter permease, partial [Candidatus Neomarinimicrobiota bacterium]
MFKNYLKIAFRNLVKFKGYSFINVFGLAIGMAGCILITLWVQRELSYDNFHQHGDRVYRVCVDAFLGRPLRAPVSPAPAAPQMIADYPEILSAVRMVRPQSVSVKTGDRQFQQAGVGYADNSLFEVFSFPLVSGDPNTALKAAHSVVISEEAAGRYFDDRDPLGEILQIDGENYSVTGVLKNLPENSHLQFEILRSFETLYVTNPASVQQWMGIAYYTYILLAENADYRQVEAKFPEMIEANLGPILKAFGGSVRLYLQPLQDIYLRSDFEMDFGDSGDITYVYLFSAIAILILLIA